MRVGQISPQKSAYLQPLTNIDKVPEKLFYRGQLPGQRLPSVAIVGSRKPTAYGKEVATKLSHELASRGVVIISGLAFGIDSIVHQTCLEAGGVTLAFIASGIDQITPRSHERLGQSIIRQGGAIISEYGPGAEFFIWQLPARNRLVSGLADALIIVEAAERSGTLITATHALNQGKPVMAVPGNITSPMSASCNQLIKQGAHPLTSYEDVLEIIAPELLGKPTQLPLGANQLEAKIIEFISQGIKDGDQLQRLTKADPAKFNQALTMLELNGAIRALGGNHWGLR